MEASVFVTHENDDSTSLLGSDGKSIITSSSGSQKLLEHYRHINSFRNSIHKWDLEYGVPRVAWKRKLNSHANLLREFNVTFKEAMKMLGLGFRLWNYVKAERSQGRKPPIDPFNREIRPSACHGVPLGGMGAGSIGRGFRGEFRRWQLLPGVCEEAPVLANQFSVFSSRGDRKKFSSVLYPGRPPDLGVDESGISSWDWCLDGQHSTYHAVFPRAWTIYEGEPDPELSICCRQVSPFIPDNYRESSYPSCVFSYTIVNTGKEAADVSLLFTWANSIGGSSHLSGGHFNEYFVEDDGVSGILLHHKTAKGNPPITFGIASQQTSDVKVSLCPSFSLNGKGSQCTAKDIWLEMKEHGKLSGKHIERNPDSTSPFGSSICAAVAASTVVQSREKKVINFVLTWDSPVVKFMKGTSYFRRYTRFYGTSGNAAAKLAHDALFDYLKWEAQIEQWQDPILKNDALPEWYRFTLFNELYYLVVGGTVWTDGGHFVQTRENNEALARKSKSLCDEESLMKENCLEQRSDVQVGNNDINEENGAMEASSIKKSNSEPNILCALEDINSSQLPILGPNDEAPLVSMETCSEHFQPRLKEHSETETLPFLASSLDESNENGRMDNDTNVGRFLYLEGVEYVMWCTYDVHFYASFALLSLFPKIELSMQREFAAATLHQCSDKVMFLAEGNWGTKNVVGAVPHDLGTHDPWLEVNAYNIHDTSRWKDLNSKFVLQVYRDYVATGDLGFAKEVWPAVLSAMAYMDQFDKDRDGLIENDGFPDQTYDTWTVHGVSAYCGGLWLAALQAAAAMAEKLEEKTAAESFGKKFQDAREAYEKKLWNESYFSYDSGTSANSKSIHADQMAGQWYSWASGLPPMFEEKKIRSALHKVFDFNVQKVKRGKIGAVNGMHPNGKVDETCMQSREIWTGVTYSLAATMIHAGMIDQAFTTAEGVYRAGWSEDGYGYWFQTPEAWTIDGHYRSLTYMRPLAIWALQWALFPPKSVRDVPFTPKAEKAALSYLRSSLSSVAEVLGSVPRPHLCCTPPEAGKNDKP